MRTIPRVRVTKKRVKKEIWKLKIFFSEWGISMTVNRCFPFTMTYLNRLARDTQNLRNHAPRRSAKFFSTFLY